MSDACALPRPAPDTTGGRAAETAARGRLDAPLPRGRGARLAGAMDCARLPGYIQIVPAMTPDRHGALSR